MTRRILRDGCITDHRYYFPYSYRTADLDCYIIHRRCENKWCVNEAHVSYELICDKGIFIEQTDNTQRAPRMPSSKERKQYIKDLKENPEDILEDYDMMNSYLRVAKKYDISKGFVRTIVMASKGVKNEYEDRRRKRVD